MTDKRIVFSTAGSEQEARQIAVNLVERKLAACVNVTGPISSTYWWQGKVEINEEWLMVIKTSAELFDEVSQAIKQQHSYELPECIAVEITDGIAEYLAWMTNSMSLDAQEE